MTHVEIRCRCGGEIEHQPIADVPPPPGALLGVGGPPPEEWKGWKWVCRSCGSDVGVTLDYGTLDLGIVRDSDVRDVESYEIFPEPPS